VTGRHADCDHWHDPDTDYTDLHQLTARQAEVARILGWTNRLSRAQWQVIEALCEWHAAGTRERGKTA
jgi:hypothetical protein